MYGETRFGRNNIRTKFNKNYEREEIVESHHRLQDIKRRDTIYELFAILVKR